jgi:hypothetical protein
MPFVPKAIFPKSSRGIAFGALLLATPIALSVLGFVRGGTNRLLTSKIETSNLEASATMTFQSNSTRLESEHITLRATGFEPAEFTRPAGRFLLSVDNRAEMGEMTFRLLRQNGTRERDVIAKHDKFRLRQVIDIAPGHYTLVVANHPEWICRITISAP